MSTISVTTLNTANGTTDLTITSGNSTTGGMIVYANGIGMALRANSTANGVVLYSNGATALGTLTSSNSTTNLVITTANTTGSQLVMRSDGQGLVFRSNSTTNTAYLYGNGTLVMGNPSTFALDTTVVGTGVINVIDDASTLFSADRYASDTSSQIWNAKKARGTYQSPSAVVNGDNLLNIRVQGYDGSAFQTVGQIVIESNGAVTAGAVPGRMIFYTAGTSGASAIRMQISNQGLVTISNNLTVSTNTFTLGTSSIVANNGYSRLPNGLLMQWGLGNANSTTAAISFTVPFTTLYSITLGSTVATNAAYIVASNSTTYTPRTASTTNPGAAFNWMAIGV